MCVVPACRVSLAADLANRDAGETETTYYRRNNATRLAEAGSVVEIDPSWFAEAASKFADGGGTVPGLARKFVDLTEEGFLAMDTLFDENGRPKKTIELFEAEGGHYSTEQQLTRLLLSLLDERFAARLRDKNPAAMQSLLFRMLDIKSNEQTGELVVPSSAEECKSIWKKVAMHFDFVSGKEVTPILDPITGRPVLPTSSR